MRKIISILCAIILCISTAQNSFAYESSDNNTSHETIQIATDKISYDKEILKNISADGKIRTTYLSRKHTMAPTFIFNTANMEEQIKAAENFIDELIKILENGRVDCTHSKDFIQNKNEGLDYYVSVDIQLTSFSYFVFEIRDNHLSFCFDYNNFSRSIDCDINNIDEVGAFLINVSNNEFECLDTFGENSNVKTIEEFETINYENQVLTDSNGSNQLEFKQMEKVEFDVTLDDSCYDTFLAEIGNENETIHCTIEQLFSSVSDYILTLEGSKEKKQLWHREYSWGFSGATIHNLTFSTAYRVENNKLMRYNLDKGDLIYIDADSLNNDITNVYLEYTYLQNQGSGAKIIATPNILQCKNIEYEFYGTQKELDRGTNIYTLFGIPEKEIYVQQIQEEMKKEEDYTPQDPERYVTKVKGTFGEDIEDYYLTFIGVIPLDLLESNQLPKWYTDLGENITATLIGFTETINGEDNDNYTMIKFTGSKKDLWFDISSINVCDEMAQGRYIAEQKLTVDMEYKSLISFDGTTQIRNTLEYDTVSATVHLSNDGKLTFEGITLNIGGNKTRVNDENINYIGGGKATYEKLW